MSLFDIPFGHRTSTTVFLALLASFVAACIIIHTVFIRRLPANAPPAVHDDFPITGAWGFWTQRWIWFLRKRKASPTGNFSFHAGPHTIVTLSGDKGRQLFFESRDLGLAEGYAVLFGSAPTVSKAHDDGAEKNSDQNNHFGRRLLPLLKTEQLRSRLPTLISDTREAINSMANELDGVTNPFESIYRIVFRLTIRIVGADEIADNPEMLEQTLKLFEMIDNSATASSVMFPKFPSLALLQRTYAGARLYMLIENIIKAREASDNKTHGDALQYLLSQGDRTFKIVEFIISALFAGLINSGINAAWVLCFLAVSPKWLAKATNEIRTTAAKYARDSTAPLQEQLADVPLEAWENEFPIMELCLRDSIRLNLLGCAMRRNVSDSAIPTGNGAEAIPPGAFVTYALGDLHLDPEVYPDPHTWDPSRYLPERAEDKKKAIHPFLGWGSGRHPCLGMRLAKLEQNLISAYFIASFDFNLVNKEGQKLDAAPPLDWNGHSAHKPKDPPLLRTRRK